MPHMATSLRACNVEEPKRELTPPPTPGQAVECKHWRPSEVFRSGRPLLCVRGPGRASERTAGHTGPCAEPGSLHPVLLLCGGLGRDWKRRAPPGKGIPHSPACLPVSSLGCTRIVPDLPGRAKCSNRRGNRGTEQGGDPRGQTLQDTAGAAALLQATYNPSTTTPQRVRLCLGAGGMTRPLWESRGSRANPSVCWPLRRVLWPGSDERADGCP